MKIKYYINSLLLLIMTFLSACSSDSEPFGEKKAAQSQLRVSTSNVSFDLTREDKVNIIAPEDLTWEAYSDASWISLDKEYGTGSSIVTISTTQDNPSTKPRSGNISLRSGRYNRSANIEVTQEGTYLNVSKDEIEFVTKSDNKSITITSNASWTIKSKPTWITVSPSYGTIGSSTVSINASANPNEYDREGSITIQNIATTKTVKVKQPRVTLQASINPNKTFEPAASKAVISVTSNSEWTIRSTASWCTLSKAYGSGNGTIDVSISENQTSSARTAYIYVESGNISKIITIKQNSIELSVSPSSLNFLKAGGSQSISITSNSSWTITSNQSWCTVSKYSGTGNISNINVSVSSNTGTTSRKAILSIKSGTITKEVIVNQDGITFTISPTSMSFDCSSSSKVLSITSNSSWSASSNRTWCTVSRSSGTGNASISISVNANTSSSSRSATVTIKSGTLTKEVSVYQEGLTFNISPTSMSFDCNSSSKTLSITSNSSWSASSNRTWCTVSRSSGTGNASISISASENTSSSSRYATVTIKSGTITKEVSISQDGITLSTSPTSMSFESNSSSLSLSITSNHSWTISSDKTWCTLSRSSGTGNLSLTVKVSENTTSSSRSATITIKAGSVTKTITVSQAAKKKTPFIITSIQIGNTDYDGNIINDYGTTIYSYQTQYLKPKLNIFVNTPGTYEIYHKLYKPDGMLSTGDSSPSGYTSKRWVTISSNTSYVYLLGWGNRTAGTWKSGQYRWEFYYDGDKIAEKTFTVY